MKNIILAVICFLGLNSKVLAQDRPTCCTDKCSKECVEKCKKNNCTDKDCCKKCGEKGCMGAACKTSEHKCGNDSKTCKAGKCDDACKVACETEGKSCCKK